MSVSACFGVVICVCVCVCVCMCACVCVCACVLDLVKYANKRRVQQLETSVTMA